MPEADLYFTHTIVGAPQTLALGRPLREPALHLDALELHLPSGRARLSPGWREWFAAQARSHAPVGVPWRRPGKPRRFLMRHNLLLSLAGWLLALPLALAWLSERVTLPPGAAHWLVQWNALLYRLTH